MPRVEIAETIQRSTTGQGINGAAVGVKLLDGTQAPVYLAPTGSATLLQPLITTNGRVEGWLDEGSYLFTITPPGEPQTSRLVEAVSGATVTWLVDNAVTQEQLEDILSGSDAAVQAHSADTTSVHGIANTADLVLTTDPRLSNARTPTTHTHTTDQVTGLDSALSSKVATTDPRLSDARAPTAHTHPISGVTGLQAALDAAANPAPEARRQVAFATGSLAVDSSASVDLEIDALATLYRVTTNRPAWVRAYSTDAHRVADLARPITEDPVGDHGCLLDLLTTEDVLTVTCAPLVRLVNMDSSVSDTIYFTIINKDDAVGAVTGNLVVRREE